MPPPPYRLASNIQGYICRSCLSKLQAPQKLRPLRQARFVASNDGPSTSNPSKGEKHPRSRPRVEPEAVVRIFDERIDGTRIERPEEFLPPEDPDHEALLESLQARIAALEEKLSEDEDIEEVEVQDMAIEQEIEEMMGGEKFEEYVSSRMKELHREVESRMEHIDVKSLSADEREDKRREFKDSILAEHAKSHLPPDMEDPNDPGIKPLSSGQGAFLLDVSNFGGVSNFTGEDNQLRVSSLNNFLLEAAQNLDKSKGVNRQKVGEGWKAYRSCRDLLLSQPQDIPPETWELLWSFFAERGIERNRILLRVGDDMMQVGLPLRKAQQLLYIRAIFALGKSHWDAALKQWEDMEVDPEDDMEFLTAYYRLGLNMSLESHRLDVALGAAAASSHLSSDDTAWRMLIPIIEAFLSSTEEMKVEKSWALYVRMRVGLGSKIEMGDYDDVTSIFFKAMEPDLALCVFRDMMLTGHQSVDQYDSTVLYQDSPGFMNDSDLLSLRQKGLKWKDPREQSTLPRDFENKFFFGKWLKKLISEEKFDDSIQVFNLMHERGIEASPIHLNGLIGAWMRAPSSRGRNHALAEVTAWRMIEQRIKFVKNRDTAAVLQYPLRATQWDDKPDHKGIWKHPNATIETFAILIEDYRRRQRHDRMKDLFVALKQAKIPPNTYFMNQMIMVETEVQQYWAWDMFTTFTREQKVIPNFDTFNFLWFLAKKAVDPTHTRHKFIPHVKSLSVSRLMFREMMIWKAGHNQNGQMPREMYDLIILSFSLAQDHAGSAIALRALQLHFNMLPNENTMRTIILQLARASVEVASGKRSRRLGLKNAQTKAKIAQVAQLLESLKSRRVEQLADEGVDFGELTEEEKSEESRLLLTMLLEQISTARLEMGQTVRAAWGRAAVEMGCEDCAPDDGESDVD